jgi:hypothetical protein
VPLEQSHPDAAGGQCLGGGDTGDPAADDEHPVTGAVTRRSRCSRVADRPAVASRHPL